MKYFPRGDYFILEVLKFEAIALAGWTIGLLLAPLFL